MSDCIDTSPSDSLVSPVSKYENFVAITQCVSIDTLLSTSRRV